MLSERDAAIRFSPLTLPEVIDWQASLRPNKVAFIFEGRETSFRQFRNDTLKIAQGLRDVGVGSGDRVAVIAKNCDTFFALLGGAARIGAVLAPVNWRLSSAEIAEILADCDPRLLLLAEGFEHIVDQLSGSRLALPIIRFTGDTQQTSVRSWLDNEAAPADDPIPSADQVMLQLYTSGTTGLPKGVMMSHRNFFGLRQDLTTRPDWEQWNEQDLTLISMPCFHLGGAQIGLEVIRYGGTGLIIQDFSVARLLDDIPNYGISKIFLVPSAIKMVLEHPQSATTDFSSLRHLRYGASPIWPDVLVACLERFDCELTQAYGMTETNGPVTALAHVDHFYPETRRLYSVGKPLPGIELRIVDEQNGAVKPNVVGEIIVRGVQVTSGYWSNSAETAKAIDADGWLHTGDAGYLDDDGYLFLTDRIKDMIISGGENIYPAEIERILVQHRAIDEAAVIGMPHEKWGEIPVAVVTILPDQNISFDELAQFARERLASFKVPKAMRVVDQFPRNASGKILKRELRRMTNGDAALRSSNS